MLNLQNKNILLSIFFTWNLFEHWTSLSIFFSFCNKQIICLLKKKKKNWVTWIKSISASRKTASHPFHTKPIKHLIQKKVSEEKKSFLYWMIFDFIWYRWCSSNQRWGASNMNEFYWWFVCNRKFKTIRNFEKYVDFDWTYV